MMCKPKQYRRTGSVTKTSQRSHILLVQLLSELYLIILVNVYKSECTIPQPTFANIYICNK